VAANLADVLPGEAIIYLENRGLAGRSLQTVLKHLDGLYCTTLASNPVMAQSQLDKLFQGPREPAYRYARRVMVLATAAVVSGEDIDLKAQRALVKGINCEVTGPKLRKAQEKPGCTFAELVKTAELTESRYLLKRDDPVMTKYISDVSDGSNPVRTMGSEGDDSTPTCRVEVNRDSGSQAVGFNRYADATCFKCGEKGHIRPGCPYTGPDKRLDPNGTRGRNTGGNGSGRGGGQRGRGGRGNRNGGNGNAGQGPSEAPGNAVPSRRIAPAADPAEAGIAPRCTIAVQTETGSPGNHPGENEGISQTQTGVTTPTRPVPAREVGPLPVREGDVILTNCHKKGSDAATGTRGWLAPVYVNGALMMLAVDTGAAMTIINTRKFLRHLDRDLLRPSIHTFHTAAGATLPALGQFAATLELGPVKVTGLVVTVAKVVGDGLLGLDFLRLADAWVGLRDGHIHMTVGGSMLTCNLRPEKYPVRYVARPVAPARIKPMTHGLVSCAVQSVEGFTALDRPGTLVTDTLWMTNSSVRVPAALVSGDRTADGRVLVPVTNFGDKPLDLGMDRPIAVLDEPDKVSVPVAQTNEKGRGGYVSPHARHPTRTPEGVIRAEHEVDWPHT
jgi:hypothetical protein